MIVASLLSVSLGADSYSESLAWISGRASEALVDATDCRSLSTC